MPNNSTADALRHTLVSPNECDVNLEAANVVDGLFFIGRAIGGNLAKIAESLQALNKTLIVLTETVDDNMRQLKP